MWALQQQEDAQRARHEERKTAAAT
jgi:hypothetical protein